MLILDHIPDHNPAQITDSDIREIIEFTIQLFLV